MRALLLTLLIAVVTAGHGFAAAPAQGERFTVTFVNTPLREALRCLFGARAADCTVALDVPNVGVSLALHNQNLRGAVDAVVAETTKRIPDLTLKLEKKQYLLYRRPAPNDANPMPAVDPDDPGPWAILDRSGAAAGEFRLVDLRGVPLLEAIPRLFEGSGLQYSVEPGIPRIPLTLNVRDVRVPELIELVVRQAAVRHPGLNVTEDRDVYVIHSGPDKAKAPRAGGPPPDRKVTLDLEKVSFRDALVLLFKDSGLKYAVDPNVPNAPISFNCRELSFSAALRLIIRLGAVNAPGLVAERDGNVWRIRLQPQPAPTIQPVSYIPDEGVDRHIAVSFHEIPLRDAIAEVFENTGLQYTIDPKVPNPPITLNLRDVTVAAALRIVVRVAAIQSPGVLVAKEENTYHIYLRERQAPDAEPPPDQLASDQDLTWEKIVLQFVDAVSLTELLGGTVMPTRDRARNGGSPDGEILHALPPLPASAAPGWPVALVPPGITGIVGIPRDNSMMVRGTPDDIQALKNVIRLLDTPQRQMAIRVSIGGVTAEGRVANNQQLRLSAGQSERSFRFTAIPRFNGDGTIDVTLHGEVKLGEPHPLTTHLRLQSGLGVPLFSLGEGAGATRIWLRATLLPEPENEMDEGGS